MKILITGAAGQLGQELVSHFGKSHEVMGTTSSSLDLLNIDQIDQVVGNFRPELLIHAAAWTNVDEAAKQPEAALKVNGQGTKFLAEAADKVNARFVYISSNEVFDGRQDRPYIETDTPHPINAYGASKLAGEQAVSEALADDRWAIVRISWLYGPTSERNFPKKIMQLADERGALKVVDDEISTPTYAPDVAIALQKVIDADLTGILHLVNEGSCSRYDWAKQILQLTGREKIPVEPITLADFVRASTPPPHCILENKRAKSQGIVLPDWQDSLRAYLAR